MKRKFKIVLTVVIIFLLILSIYSCYCIYTFFHLFPEKHYHIYPASCYFHISDNDAEKINDSISSELTKILGEKGYKVNYLEGSMIIFNETIVPINKNKILVWNTIISYGNKTNSPFISTEFFPYAEGYQDYNEDGKIEMMKYMRNRLMNILEIFNITVNWNYAMWVFTPSQ